MPETVIKHYGVKGMKWGVRKQRPTSSGARKGKTNAQRIYEKVTGKNKKQAAPPKAVSTKRTKVSEMSDEELRKVISRMQMERQYAQLTQREVNKGRKFVQEVLYNSARTTATTYATKAMTKAIEKLLRSSSSGSGGGSGSGSGSGSS